MDTCKKVKEWAERMGYQGTIPDSLQNICTATTGPLWEQLMQKVAPADHVRRIKNNILINRLKNKDKSHVADQIEFPITNLEIWEKRRNLEEELNIINIRIVEKEQAVNDVSKQNKMKYASIDSLKQKITENELKTFMLNRKSVKLEKEIEEVEEKLIFCKNLTPIETQQNKMEVQDTLKKCADKIETLVAEQNTNPCLTLCSLPPIPSTPTNKSNLRESLISSGNHYSKHELTQDSLSDDLHCFRNVDLLQNIEYLIHHNDNYLMWNIILELLGTFKIDLMKIITSRQDTVGIVGKEKSSKSIFVLHSLHIENELKTMKYERSLKKIEQMYCKKLNELYDKLETFNGCETENLKNILLLQMKDAGQNAEYKCLIEQLETLQSATDVKMELRATEIKSLNVQQKMIENMQKIDYELALFKKIYFAMYNTKDETFMLVRKLNQFTNNLCWTLPLTLQINTDEIGVFNNFPLEYNHLMKLNERKMYTRNILTNTTLNKGNVDQDALHMLITLIGSPFNPPETLLLNLLNNKIKLSVLKSLQNVCRDVNYKTYTFEELKRQESYVEYAIEKLNRLMKSSAVNSASSKVTRMRETMDLWLEMPMKNFVSPKRLYNNYNIEYYQDLYDSQFNLLK